MSFTAREWWGVIHGMGLGSLFLLAFAGGLAGLYSLKPALFTPEVLIALGVLGTFPTFFQAFAAE